MIDGFKLNSTQEKAVRDTEGAILVIAGAGSGKTRVLTARICHLINSGVDPYNILAITFTNKAANEMKARITNSNAAGQGVWTSTFHSMCAKILRQYAVNLSYSNNFTIYSDLESDRVVKRICADYPDSDPKLKSNYVWHISRAKTLGLSPAEYSMEIDSTVSDANVIITVYKRYEEELKKSNAMDFDDLLLKTVELFEKFPEVLAAYQKRFRYIHVDEFQDTNFLQYDLVKKLAGYHGNLFVVGDEDQSIYSWRGAEIKNILGFNKAFKNVKVYKLEQNYRSTTSILKCANNIIENNSERNTKTLWSELVDENPIECYQAYSDRDEASYVTKKISFLKRSGGRYSDCAILMRVNALTRIFEEELNLHGIPYKVFGGFRFFERKEIKDTLAYARLALNKADNDSLLRVINYPKRGIGNSSVEGIVSIAKAADKPIYEVLNLTSGISPNTMRKVAPFIEIIDDLASKSEIMSPVDFINYLVRRSGIEDFLKSSSDPDDANRLENVQELVNAVTQFQKDNPQSGVAEFLVSVALVSDTDEMDDNNYVTIATVHAVKGLEFENVFIAGLEDGIFPTSRSLNDNNMEEERRLMYVAVTRAKKRLFCSNARSRFRFGETVAMPPSRFLSEMRGVPGSVRIIDNYPVRGGGYSSRADNDTSLINGALGNNLRNNGKKFSKTSDTQKVAMQNAAFGLSGTAKKNSLGGSSFDEYVVNVTVEHTKYGRGIIISTEGEGENKVAAIAFKGLGVKRFSLSVASAMIKIVK